MLCKMHKSYRAFQPTLPVRGATRPEGRYPIFDLFQPTLPVRGATFGVIMFIQFCNISTHAPRAGSDVTYPARLILLADFNPRSPCGERHLMPHNRQGKMLFQPTLPVRGATSGFALALPYIRISTHAPRAGSDLTSSCPHTLIVISTHAPRAGSDPAGARSEPVQQDFNPRSPCGERQDIPLHAARCAVFQPTLPVRGATQPPAPDMSHVLISTHAPRAGSDPLFSRTPRIFCISTHAPRAGSDVPLTGQDIPISISTHAPRAGSDLTATDVYKPDNYISTHAPRAGSDLV